MDKPGAGRSRGVGRASQPQQGYSNRGRRHYNPQQESVSGFGRGSSGGSHPPGPPRAWGQPPGDYRGAYPKAAPSQKSCGNGSSAPYQQGSGGLGRATSHREETSVKEDMRGSVRGKRVITEIVRSRPSTLVNKSGTLGRQIIVQANYFRVLKKPEWSIHQYRVDFAPETDMIRVRRAYLAHHKELLGGYIFDGTILFCTKYLGDQASPGNLELMTKNREGEIIQIKIKHVGIVEATDIQLVQVMNLILRRSMEGLNLQLVGRNFFDPVAKVTLDSFKLEIWPGYQTSIRQHERDILLCAEIAHKVMRTESVYQILSKCIQEAGDYQTRFKREVVGIIVITDYNNKTYRVDDIDFSSSPNSKFSTKDGEISYIQYYKKRYNITIRDYNQPLLVSRPTERNIRGGQSEFIMLVPELARATGMTDEMRNNFQLMKAMSEHTRLNPERRIERLRVFNKRLQDAKVSMDVLESWNMKLDVNLVELPGRILSPQNISFGAGKRVMCDDRADWTREFRDNPMFLQHDIHHWFVVVPRRSKREAQEFVRLCIQAARGMKLQIKEPKYQEIPDDRNASYSQGIETVATNDPQMAMIVLPNNNEEKYSCIKKKCCVDRPMPSQVVTLRTIAPRGNKAAGLMSVATKVVIQINAKLKGAPWMINMPLPGIMTVGFDVCHSAKDKNKSFGALVATMDMTKSVRYFSAVTEHLKGQEISNEVALNMTMSLKAYRAEHGALPVRILFFRDGVGDGQLQQIVDIEVTTIKNKMDEIYKSAGIEEGCRLVFIVVSKRINTRYFVNRHNPVPGTVVDDIITLPERYDFFLVSQSVRQGTVSPTSYNIIFDNSGLTADKIQALTYKMTHMYYNWSGTCRVPAVCQYAHKLAFLVAESIHRVPSNVLENQLYFL